MSEAVAGTQLPVGIACAFVGGARAVTAQHLPALSASQPHQVALLHALAEHLGGEPMADQERMHVPVETGLRPPR
jgi:hypothetical protein